MTKEKLEQYIDVKTEIIKLEKRIEKLRKQSEMVSDVVQNGYKRHAIIYGIDLKRKNKIEKYENKLVEFKDKLIQNQTDVENWIEEIKDSKTREIMRYRYLDGMTWNQIQLEAEYGHEDTARNKHDKFLKNFLKNPT